MSLIATQTGSGWDVDEATGGSPVIALDGNGRPIGLKDPTSGQSVFGDALLTVPVLTPNGFRWTDHGLTLRRTAAGIVTDFDITDLIPTTGTDYYVDPANTTGVASDAGAVLRHFNCGTVANAAGYTGTVKPYYA